MKNTTYLIAMSSNYRGYEIIDQLEKTDYPERVQLSDEKRRLRQEYIIAYTGYYNFSWRSFRALPIRLQKELKNNQ